MECPTWCRSSLWCGLSGRRSVYAHQDNCVRTSKPKLSYVGGIPSSHAISPTHIASYRTRTTIWTRQYRSELYGLVRAFLALFADRRDPGYDTRPWSSARTPTWLTVPVHVWMTSNLLAGVCQILRKPVKRLYEWVMRGCKALMIDCCVADKHSYLYDAEHWSRC